MAAAMQAHSAHQLLAEVYGRFAEGFDTADLQELGPCWWSCQVKGEKGACLTVPHEGRT